MFYKHTFYSPLQQQKTTFFSCIQYPTTNLTFLYHVLIFNAKANANVQFTKSIVKLKHVCKNVERPNRKLTTQWQLTSTKYRSPLSGFSTFNLECLVSNFINLPLVFFTLRTWHRLADIVDLNAEHKVGRYDGGMKRFRKDRRKLNLLSYHGK